MKLIVTGSLAFDHIMVFKDYFKNHILPDKIHILNVSFGVENLQKEFGGTAGNIAYTLALLGEESEIVATVGKDFAEYEAYLKAKKIATKQVKTLENEWTAQCFITTDLDDNQITAFHGGAMFQAHHKELEKDFVGADDLVIIAPNGKEAMQKHADFCRNEKVRFVFDPGQSLPAFSGEELKELLQGAEILIVNDYEWQLFQDKTGLNQETVFGFTENLIVTLGKNGSLLKQKNKEIQVAAALSEREVDPTGCGDAYRSGLMFGLKKKYSLEKSARIASVVASFAIEKEGTQKHVFEMTELKQRYQTTFGESFM